MLKGRLQTADRANCADRADRGDCALSAREFRMWHFARHRFIHDLSRKSVFDTLSAKDVIIILKGNILSATSVLLFPLFLGYLVSKLMSTEAENTYQLYACALALCLNGLIGGLGMHQRSYRCEILGIKIGSALRGLVCHKVGTILESVLCIFRRLNWFF